MKKNFLITAIWAGLLSFLIMNFNIPLIVGLIIGAAYRLIHGTAISYAIGVSLGVLLVEFTKFITYKG